MVFVAELRLRYQTTASRQISIYCSIPRTSSRPWRHLCAENFEEGPSASLRPPRNTMGKGGKGKAAPANLTEDELLEQAIAANKAAADAAEAGIRPLTSSRSC